MLEAFGVDGGVEQVYLAVLNTPGITADTLAAHSSMNPQIVTAAVRSLVELGLVNRDDAGLVRALPPDRAVDLLIAREEGALEARRAQLAASREAIPTLVRDYVDHGRSFVGDQVELLTEVPLVRARLYQLTSQAARTAWALSPGEALSENAIGGALPLDRELAERGVDARMVVSSTSLGPPHWMDYLLTLGRLGHQVRASSTLSQRCIIVDGTYAVVPTSDGPSPGAYVLRGRSLVAPLVALFEEVWSGAEPVSHADGAGDDDGPVSEARMRQVAALLARGLKDDAVARRLGVSVRTVRRLTAATLEELQADSRFQAGVLAVRRGWVDPGS